MIVLNILGYFGRNKQNSYAALKYCNHANWKGLVYLYKMTTHTFHSHML